MVAVAQCLVLDPATDLVAGTVGRRHQIELTKAWIDLLSDKLSTPEGFREATGNDPVPVEHHGES